MIELESNILLLKWKISLRPRLLNSPLFYLISSEISFYSTYPDRENKISTNSSKKTCGPCFFRDWQMWCVLPIAGEVPQSNCGLQSDGNWKVFKPIFWHLTVQTIFCCRVTRKFSHRFTQRILDENVIFSAIKHKPLHFLL